MQVGELVKKLGLEEVQPLLQDQPIQGGYTSDLLSDVMAHAQAGQVLITIQAHKNTIAVAGLIGIPAIIIANNRPLPEDMIEAARKEQIGLFRSGENQFILSGKLFQILYPNPV
ncbi:MAG TPA: hypothetical protein PLG79_00455 [Spirochaetales bacterium]|nr:hypothetical protein [Spirochaetales bacterium]